MMSEKKSYEYAVIRFVPKVEREEFINVGVVLYCKKFNFLKAICLLDERKMTSLNTDYSLSEINAYLDAFKNICDGNSKAGPIAKLEMAVRFRWLTAKRSSVVQTSSVHIGLCIEPILTLNKLFKELV